LRSEVDAQLLNRKRVMPINTNFMLLLPLGPIYIS